MKPRFLDRCGSGPLVVVEVPVSNWVRKAYRDDATRIQLHDDERHRLIRIVSDMKPFRYLPLPWGGSIDGAR